MTLSWNNIRIRAFAFNKACPNIQREAANPKFSSAGFLRALNISRKQMVKVDEWVKKLNFADGRINLMCSNSNYFEKIYIKTKEYYYNSTELQLQQLIIIGRRKNICLGN